MIDGLRDHDSPTAPEHARSQRRTGQQTHRQDCYTAQLSPPTKLAESRILAVAELYSGAHMRLFIALGALGLSASAHAAITIVSASCTATANVLRYECDVETDIPGRVQVAFDDGTTVRTSAKTPPATTFHHVILYGMTAGTTYDWTATAEHVPTSTTDTATGSFTTGALHLYAGCIS